MAIIPRVPGVTISVRVGDNDVTEHVDPENPTATREIMVHGHPHAITKYIESVDNAEYRVHITIDGRYNFRNPTHCLNISVSIDGVWQRGELCRGFNITSRAWEKNIDGRLVTLDNGASNTQMFKFTGVNIVDDNDEFRISTEMKRAQNLGVIEVRIWRCTEVGVSQFKPVSTTVDDSEIAEKALKGKSISHSTSFAEGNGRSASEQRAPRYMKCPTLPGERGPLAIFRFLYRSKAALQAEKIIPAEAPVNPANLEVPNVDNVQLIEDIDNLTYNQIRQLAKERLAQQLNHTPVKKEESDINVFKKPEEEEEPEPVKRELVPVIDLSRRPSKHTPSKEKVRKKASIKREHAEAFDMPRETLSRPLKITKRRDGKEVIDLLDD